MQTIKRKRVRSLREFIHVLTKLKGPTGGTERYFRGEPKDYKEAALQPSIYRNPRFLKNEPNIYREMQRFNDQEFSDDKTTFDKLSRMQHYEAPTRLVDMSEDALSALYFALTKGQQEKEKPHRKKPRGVVYVIDVASNNLRYYDSDAVSVVANLVKSPLSANTQAQKNKQSIACDARKYRKRIKAFNKRKSIRFLLHDIKEEKPYFSNIIDPKHIFSVQCVKPKFTHSRINSQKGAFLLFGLNPDNIHESIRLIGTDGKMLCLNSSKVIQHPIKRITKIVIGREHTDKMRKELEKGIGIKTPFIYPEMDKVADYLKTTVKTVRK